MSDFQIKSQEVPEIIFPAPIYCYRTKKGAPLSWWMIEGPLGFMKILSGPKKIVAPNNQKF